MIIRNITKPTKYVGQGCKKIGTAVPAVLRKVLVL